MYIFVSTEKFPVSTGKFPVTTLVGVFVGILWCVLHTEKASVFVGISVDIFVYTLVGIFVGTGIATGRKDPSSASSLLYP